MECLYTAKVEQTRYDNRFGHDRVLLIGVERDGKPWRDHLWIKPRSKDYKKLRRGQAVTFTAQEYTYIDINTNKPTKLGLKHIRSIKHVN